MSNSIHTLSYWRSFWIVAAVVLLGTKATAAFSSPDGLRARRRVAFVKQQQARRRIGVSSLLPLHAVDGASALTAAAAAANAAATSVSASLSAATTAGAGAGAAVATTTVATTSTSLILAEGSNFVTSFQENHTFLQGLLLTIAIKIAVGEIRRIVEKPIMDEAGRRVTAAAKEQLTPDTEQIEITDWAKLVGCIGLDLAGDASELIPVLGEFTDVAFAPAEAGLLQLLFKSPAISAFGFVEEILPFTDVIPTFTLSWVLSTLFPTTPFAKALLPQDEKQKAEGEAAETGETAKKL